MNIHSTVVSPERHDAAASFQLTSGQAGVWFAHQIAPDKSAFSVGQYTEILGSIDPAVFEAAARDTIAATETLCLRFAVGSQGPVQWIDKGIATHWRLSLYDLSGEADPYQAAQSFMRAAMLRALRARQQRAAVSVGSVQTSRSSFHLAANLPSLGSRWRRRLSSHGPRRRFVLRPSAW